MSNRDQDRSRPTREACSKETIASDLGVLSKLAAYRRRSDPIVLASAEVGDLDGIRIRAGELGLNVVLETDAREHEIAALARSPVYGALLADYAELGLGLVPVAASENPSEHLRGAIDIWVEFAEPQGLRLGLTRDFAHAAACMVLAQRLATARGFPVAAESDQPGGIAAEMLERAFAYSYLEKLASRGEVAPDPRIADSRARQLRQQARRARSERAHAAHGTHLWAIMTALPTRRELLLTEIGRCNMDVVMHARAITNLLGADPPGEPARAAELYPLLRAYLAGI